MLYACIYADGEGADVVRQAFWNYMKSPRSEMNEQQLVTPCRPRNKVGKNVLVPAPTPAPTLGS